MSSLLVALLTSSEICQVFVQTKMLDLLAVDISCVDILSQIWKNDLNSLPSEGPLKRLDMSATHPLEVLRFAQLYLDLGPKINSGFPFFDALLRLSKSSDSLGRTFVELFGSLGERFDPYRTAPLNACAMLVSSKSRETINACYGFLR
jgi:hypothetical protein